MTTVRAREDIPVEYTWDIESIYPSTEAWERAFQEARQALATAEDWQGTLDEGPERLAAWLDFESELTSQVMRLYNYASLLHESDATDQRASAMNSRVMGLWGQTAAETAFARPEILAIGEETLRRWLAESEALAVYEHHLDQILRLRAHVRAPEVEALLGAVTDPFMTAASTADRLLTADLRFDPAQRADGEEVPVLQGNIDALVTHADRTLRRTAWQSYADAHLRFRHTLANSLATSVKQHVFMARARRYDSSLAAALAETFIPPDVFHTILDTFRRHLPTWHRYWRVRRAAMGVETLHVYDIKAPLTAASPTIPYQQAIDWISEGMAPLGEAYIEPMRRGLLEERWVDVYPSPNKRSGAFSAGTKGTHPFILMNFTDDMESLSTLAHELGHSMHSYFTWQAQPFIYSDYGIFLAEVASNFNQALVRAYLLATQPDSALQIALIEEAMSNFHRYFFVMPTLARFELELHERVERGEALTADGMNARMVELFREGYGGEVAIDEARVGITWAQFPHLYANFYVYQYATGIAAAHALADRVRAEGAPAAAAYLAFLRSGGSRYPLETLQQLGVDLTTPEPVEHAFEALGGLVERLEQLIEAGET